MSVRSDSWIAQPVITGTDPLGYTLDSIQLLMNSATGSPAGFSVSIYSSLNGEPYNNLGNLVGSDPSAGGIFTYNASGILFSPYTRYLVVVTAATSVAQGAYSWSVVNGSTIDNNWEMYPNYYNSADGSSWTEHPRQGYFQLAIYATPILEPETYALAGLGLTVLSFWRLRQIK
jgi:hypothetical protein